MARIRLEEALDLGLIPQDQIAALMERFPAVGRSQVFGSPLFITPSRTVGPLQRNLFGFGPYAGLQIPRFGLGPLLQGMGLSPPPSAVTSPGMVPVGAAARRREELTPEELLALYAQMGQAGALPRPTLLPQGPQFPLPARITQQIQEAAGPGGEDVAQALSIARTALGISKVVMDDSTLLSQIVGPLLPPPELGGGRATPEVEQAFQAQRAGERGTPVIPLAAENAARLAQGALPFTEAFTDPRFPGLEFPTTGPIEGVPTTGLEAVETTPEVTPTETGGGGLAGAGSLLGLAQGGVALAQGDVRGGVSNIAQSAPGAIQTAGEVLFPAAAGQFVAPGATFGVEGASTALGTGAGAGLGELAGSIVPWLGPASFAANLGMWLASAPWDVSSRLAPWDVRSEANEAQFAREAAAIAQARYNQAVYALSHLPDRPTTMQDYQTIFRMTAPVLPIWASQLGNANVTQDMADELFARTRVAAINAADAIARMGGTVPEIPPQFGMASREHTSDPYRLILPLHNVLPTRYLPAFTRPHGEESVANRGKEETPSQELGFQPEKTEEPQMRHLGRPEAPVYTWGNLQSELLANLQGSPGFEGSLLQQLLTGIAPPPNLAPPPPATIQPGATVPTQTEPPLSSAPPPEAAAEGRQEPQAPSGESRPHPNQHSFQHGGLVPRTGTYTLHQGELVIPVHHEEGETIQREDGKWINVYGRNTRHAGRLLPKVFPFEKDAYDTEGEASRADQMRSDRTIERDDGRYYDRETGQELPEMRPQFAPSQADDLRAYLSVNQGGIQWAKKNPDPKKFWRLAFTPQEGRAALLEGTPAELPVVVPQAVTRLPGVRMVAAVEAARRAQHEDQTRTLGDFLSPAVSVAPPLFDVLAKDPEDLRYYDDERHQPSSLGTRDTIVPLTPGPFYRGPRAMPQPMTPGLRESVGVGL